jgi:hypothetical protein
MTFNVIFFHDFYFTYNFRRSRISIPSIPESRAGTRAAAFRARR